MQTASPVTPPSSSHPLVPQRTPMLTATGEPVIYTDPSCTRVLGMDVFLHLSTQRRYLGAIDVPILLHLALCTRLAQRSKLSQEVIAYAAAHDVHEAYIGDMPTALKEVLPSWKALIEDPWEGHVHRQLGLEWPPAPRTTRLVKAIDLTALLVEMRCFEHACYAEAAGRIGRGATSDEMEVLAGLLRNEPRYWYGVVADAIHQGGGVLLKRIS